MSEKKNDQNFNEKSYGILQKANHLDLGMTRAVFLILIILMTTNNILVRFKWAKNMNEFTCNFEKENEYGKI